MAVVEIEILGRRYSLQSDREPEHIQAVAAFVDDRLRQAGRSVGRMPNQDDAVLVALNIASELFLVRDRSADFAKSLDRRISSLVALIDHGISVTTDSSLPPS